MLWLFEVHFPLLCAICSSNLMTKQVHMLKELVKKRLEAFKLFSNFETQDFEVLKLFHFIELDLSRKLTTCTHSAIMYQFRHMKHVLVFD